MELISVKDREGFIPKTTGVKNKKGEIILDKKTILSTWKEHFEELLKNEDKTTEETTTGLKLTHNILNFSVDAFRDSVTGRRAK